MLLTNAQQEAPSLKSMLERLWRFEAIGIVTEPTYSEEEIQVLGDFRQNLVQVDLRYVASFPWKIRHPPLPTNITAVKQRLNSLLRKLRSQPEHLRAYDEVRRQQLTAGYIEEVNDDQDAHVETKIHYLPHRAVYNNSVSTPLRVVFDASARSGSGQSSLNDCLFSGPSLNPEIPSLLLQFRNGRYVFVADIAKAYLQIGLAKRDQDATRFFWPANAFDPESQLKTYRFKVVLFNATCSQFLLNATLQELAKYPENVTSELRNHLYLDNVVYSTMQEEKICEFYYRSRQLLKDAGFELGQWASNLPRLTEIIRTEGSGISSPCPSTVSVLGLCWALTADELYIASPEWATVCELTKRVVVSEAVQVFDPLGWLAPVAVRAKLFIQQLWRCKVGWDVKLVPELSVTWQQWKADMTIATTLGFPRPLELNTDTRFHLFVAASFRAYGAVLYARLDGSSHLLMAKSRIAPNVPPTIPKLELLAAILGTRLTFFIRQTVNKIGIPNPLFVCWSDSKVVLHWLNSTAAPKGHVATRVSEVKRLLPDIGWKYIPTAENPQTY